MRFNLLILLTTICITELAGLPLLSGSFESGHSVIPATEQRLVEGFRDSGENVYRTQTHSTILGQFEGMDKYVLDRKEEVRARNSKRSPNPRDLPSPTVEQIKAFLDAHNRPLQAGPIRIEGFKPLSLRDVLQRPRGEQVQIYRALIEHLDRHFNRKSIETNSKQLREHNDPAKPFQLNRVAYRNAMDLHNFFRNVAGRLSRDTAGLYPELGPQIDTFVENLNRANRI